MQPYKLEIINSHEFMQVVIFKANELGYRLRDPRIPIHELYEKNDYMILTDTGAIVFTSNSETYENTPAKLIDISWFRTKKADLDHEIKVTMKMSEYENLCKIGINYDENFHVYAQNWRVESCQ